MTATRPQQPTEVLAVALPVLAVGNSVAVVLVLQSRWFWGFFDPLRVPVAFFCFSFVLGVVCWLISRRVEGLYERVAISGVVLCGVTSIVIALLALAALLIWFLWSDGENESRKPGKPSRRRRSRSRRPRQRRSRRRRY